jgi:hypothetical protein
MIFLLLAGAGSIAILAWLRVSPDLASLRRRRWNAFRALSLTRLSCLWFGGALLGQAAGPAKALGYALLLATFPEAILVQSLRSRPLVWALVLTPLLLAGSFAWIGLLARLAEVGRRKSAATDAAPGPPPES